jgi:hypothetical protein
MMLHQLKIEAETQPKILLNRLHITVCGDVEYADMTALLESLRAVYATHITGMHHVLPSRSNPPELVKCITRLRMEPATADTDAIVPLVATELSGKVKVVSKKRGVVVVVEFDKQQHFPNGAGDRFEEY